MLDSILNSAKGELLNQLGSKFNLNPDQAGKTVDAAKKSVTDGLLKEVTSGNVSGLVNLFNGKSSVTGNPIVNGIAQQLVTSLVQKVGLNQQMAGTVSNFIVPFIVSKISGSKQGGGFGADDITSMLGGGVGEKIKSALGGDVGGALGKLFGK